MLARVLGWLIAAVVLGVLFVEDSAATAGEVVAPTMGQRLRYVGRDWSTGLATPVDDHFIAEFDRYVERYGQDRVDPIPPPPLDGTDISSISIPAIAVSARIARYGVDEFGRLDVPQDTRTVGWNPGYSALPGTGGATFFAAHVELLGVPGVFARLNTLRPGDEVVVSLTDGARYTYRVSATVDYALANADMGALLAGREGSESITLMTCSGPPDEDYPLRTVVFAERVSG